GMTTMRARAVAEGGLLHIESVAGSGTTVTLSLPALRQVEATGVFRRPGQRDDALRPTIVVCDDNQDLRDAVKLVLPVPRFHIVGEAADGETCLERVRNFRPDVLILDVSMPGGGPELAAAARDLNPEMHIVVFSAGRMNRPGMPCWRPVPTSTS
ncbi:MAG: response regulator, partial [Nakamurella sp.]